MSSDQGFLDDQDEAERQTLLKEREANERRHKEIVIRLSQLEMKRLGRAYKFQNAHEHT